MQFEYDPERLIEEVKKRPGIWDYEDEYYRAKNTRYKLWSEIVNELMNPEVKVSKSEKRELEIQLQKKWKSIRDCFQKYITNPNRTKRPYIYFKQLQFLLKDQDAPQKEDATGSTDSEDNSKPAVQLRKVWRPKQRLKVVKDEDQTSEEENDSNIDNTQDDSNDATDNDRPVKVAKLSKDHDEFVFANVDASKNEVEDADKLFLLSLLPHLKTIPEQLRLNVKLELMQVLRNANYNSVREHTFI